MSPHWRSWFATAVLRFGLSPDDFWRLSVLEWRALCAGPEAANPPDRQTLTALMTRYPDGDDHDRHV